MAIKQNNQDLTPSLDLEHKLTIIKMSKIFDILLNDRPNDKRFKDNEAKYLIEVAEIFFCIEQDKVDYSDAYIKKRVDSLYKSIFKHRRY